MNLDRPDLSSFSSTTKALFSRVRGHIEPGSHRMLRLLSNQTLSKLARIPTILVGGTNGKGTICAILEKTFRDHGLRTALYTSPHLVSPTERIRFSGLPISTELFLRYSRMSFEAAQGKLPDATFFELMTALAFEAIAASEVEIFICEVGLGGRMDSTNILSPDLSILTSIGLDHTEWLGSTEEKIAFEKSFISRRNRPLIIGPISQSAKMGISSALEITGAKAVFIEPLDEDSTIDHFVSPHVSDSQTDSVQRPSKNAVPLPSLEICREALRHLSHRDGLKFSPDQLFASAQSTRWPGRADLRTINATPVLLDGAHNSHGVSYFLSHTLRDTVLKFLPTPWFVVFASLSDKDWSRCIDLLTPHANTMIFTQTQSTRAVPAISLFQYTREAQPDARCLMSEASSEALTEGLRLAAEQKGTLLVLGSLTLIGEAMEFFHLPVFTEFEPGD